MRERLERLRSVRVVDMEVEAEGKMRVEGSIGTVMLADSIFRSKD